MRVYEEFTRTITTKEPVGFKCDCCSTESKKRMEQVQMNHNGWGNDSIDSYVTKDYCSLECYRKLAITFLEEFSGYADSSLFDNIDYDKIKILIGEK